MPRVSDQYKAGPHPLAVSGDLGVYRTRRLQGLTLDDVISASGYTAGMVYNYFGGRDELVAGASAAALAQLEEVFIGPVFSCL